MTWTDVRDSMPDTNKPIWIWMPNLKKNKGLLISVYKDTFRDLCGEKWPENEVTHWKYIEIPKTPREEMREQ